MVSYAFIDGFTRSPRASSIERLKHAIAVADGVIVDFAFFESTAVRMTVELDDTAMLVLKDELERAGIELFPQCLKELQRVSQRPASEHRHPILAMLHVAFMPGEIDSVTHAH